MVRPAFVAAFVAGVLLGCQAFLSSDGDVSASLDAGDRDGAPPLSDAADATRRVDDAGANCPPPGDRPASQCPLGSHVWRGRCYFVGAPEAALTSHAGAQAACAEAGAYLVTVTCPSEWTEVQTPLGLLAQNAWIGATHLNPNVEPEWATNEPWTFNSPAAPVEADAALGCVVALKGGQWSVIPCASNNAHGICEIGPFVGE